MKKRLQAKLAMFQTVQSVLDANESKWGDIPAMVGTVETFRAKVLEMQTLASTSNSHVLGITANKNVYRKNTITLADEICGATHTYAIAIGDAILGARTNIKTGDFIRASKNDLIILLDRVLAAAFENLTSLIDYGITEADVQQLQARRNALNTYQLAPREAIMNRKMEIRKLEETSDAISFLLKTGIDPLMKIIRRNHPEFYDLFKDSRKIYDPAQRSKRLENDPEPPSDDGF